MVKVFAWPPVGVTGAEWTEEAPVSISRSLLTGAERVSAAQRIRRLVTLAVPGFGRTAWQAGYMEMLKRYLAGVHLVRLYSYPVNWHLDVVDDDWRRSNPLVWFNDGNELPWQSPYVRFYSGVRLTGSVSWIANKPVALVSGLPPRRLVARPGEFITFFSGNSDTTGATVQIAAPAMSDEEGNAVIRLFESPGEFENVRINLGVCDTGVFRPVRYPRAVQPVSGDWVYTWEFREVFEDETDGFEEIDPWTVPIASFPGFFINGGNLGHGPVAGGPL